MSHAVQAIALLTLIASGGMILLSYPRLHWGEFGSHQDAGFGLSLPMTKFFLGGGRTLHFLAAWVLVVNGVISFLAGLFSGRLRRVILHLRKTPGMYSGVQRLAYATLILLVVPLMVLSGLTMSPSVIADYPSLAVLFSGRHSARTVHFILAVSITLFTIGHILLALRSPARLLGMATGRPIVGEIS